MLSLKFWENFLRSFNFTAFDSRWRVRVRSETRSFSWAENALNESRRACSTLAVAFSCLSAFRGPVLAVPTAALGFGACSTAGLAGGGTWVSVFSANSFVVDEVVEVVVAVFGGATALTGSGVDRLSGTGLAVRCVVFAADSGRAICEDMMAGS